MAYVQSQKHARDKVHLTILRDNATKELDLILGESPSQQLSDFSNKLSSYDNNNPQECITNVLVLLLKVYVILYLKDNGNKK
jgi:hypothetical protein